MTPQEAIATIVDISKRPDKETKALEGINRAITRFSSLANWKKDLVEDSITIDSTVYGDTIDFSTLFPKFKKFKYIKPYGQRQYLRLTEPEHILVPRGTIQPNKYYTAGSTLTYTLSTLTSALDVGVYNYPTFVTLDDEDTWHWMLTLMPFALIDYSVAHIFQSIGDDNSMKFYLGSAQEAFLIARGDFEDQAVPAAQ